MGLLAVGLKGIFYRTQITVGVLCKYSRVEILSAHIRAQVDNQKLCLKKRLIIVLIYSLSV
jgi:hypothetical protein